MSVECVRMHWSTLGAFIALEIVLCYIPGPAVMAVVGAALTRERAGFGTALGILTGNLLYYIVSALGIASVILASQKAFAVIKLCGAAYLAYLGIRALFTTATNEGASVQRDQNMLVRGWARGTVTQLANPKALVFTVAILPQFIDPHGNVLLQIGILCIAGLLVEFVVLSTYILAADRIRRGGLVGRSRVLAERIGGVFLLGVAAAVAREAF